MVEIYILGMLVSFGLCAALYDEEDSVADIGAYVCVSLLWPVAFGFLIGNHFKDKKEPTND